MEEESGEEEPRQGFAEYYGKYTFDNIHQYKIEDEYPHLVSRIVSEIRRGNFMIDDPELIGDISYFLTFMTEIADKYDAVSEIVSTVINQKTGQPYTLESFSQYVDTHMMLPAAKTKAVISALGRKYAVVMARKASMRKGTKDKLPFLDRVAQKLQFTNWLEEEQEYFDSIVNKLHQSEFLINHYRVMEDGEIHMLMSGDNKSGKTGTSTRFAIYSWKDLRGFFRPYIEEQIKNGHYIKMDGSPYKNFNELVPEHFRLKDRMIMMDRKHRLGLLASSPFPDLIYDEGNFTNLNLKSMDPESVEETMAAYGARNKHPFVIYNYQNSNRPTLFLREKFNVWFHKIHINVGFLLIRQRLIVPGKDPWLVKRLSKILESGNDDAIYGFFKRHPYTMQEFDNLRDMPKKLRDRYDIRRQKAQTDYYNKRNAASQLEEARSEIAYDLAEKVSNGKMAFAALDKALSDMGVSSMSERNRIKGIAAGIISQKNIIEKHKRETADG